MYAMAVDLDQRTNILFSADNSTAGIQGGYYHKPNVLEAITQKGASHPGDNAMMGDALLIDLDRHFFAVADSPDRSPGASKEFLNNLHLLMNHLKLDTLEEAFGNDAVQRDVDRIVAGTNRLIKNVKFNESTTFTGIFIIKSDNVKKMLLLHNGDSLLFHFRLNEQRFDQLSQTNHCFVGKTDTLYQVQLFEFYTDSRLLLATDGYWDIVRSLRAQTSEPIDAVLLDLMATASIDKFASSLIKRYNLGSQLSDDLGLIALNPNSVSAVGKQPIVI